MGMAANEIQSAGKLIPSIGIGSTLQASKFLTKEKAREFYKQANNDKEEAKRLAAEQGYKWTSGTK